jgi:AcrR family transcriptional regulator
MNSTPTKNEGRRDRKKRATLQRIAETGLKLFIENGYEGTTLEAIAAASGIARRTFFYYYKSKDEILMATLGGGMVEALGLALVEQSKDQSPLNAVRNCLLQLTSLLETKESIIVDGLLSSTEALRARKQAMFVELEQSVFAALCELWPQAKRRAAHRMVAMVSIGAMRLAMEAWRHDGGKKPLPKYLRENFATLESEIRTFRR